MRSVLRRMTLAALAVIATGAAAAPAAAAPAARTGTLPTAHLTGVSITFHTNDDDLDFDTDVLLFIVRGDGSGAAAERTGTLGHFDDNTFNGPFPLFTDTGTVATQLSTFDVNIIIIPFFNDTWKFDYAATLSFSDGTSFVARESNLRLDQDNNVLFTPFTLVTQVIVPDVTGDSQGDAGATLRAAGLTVGNVGHHVDPTCTFVNTVSSQNPRAGTAVDPGTAVNLTIGDKPKTPCD